MQNMSREELVRVLDDIRGRVASGDSFEGNLQYFISDGDHPYDVAAAYRIGNSMGQGGMTLIGVTTQDTSPVEEIACRVCGDTDGPFEQQTDGSYHCEGCIKKGGAS
ncbi:hypothetical protein [Streptomyces noursei]|uniref:hypothetical protein n=1 Tax=Streptomyces noursei TaxID=1971 RepID=UPI0035D84DB7